MGLTAVAASFAIETLEQASRPEAAVAGQNRLLHHPEFQDPEKAQSLMSYLAQTPEELPEFMGEEPGGTGVHRTGKCVRGTEGLQCGPGNL